MNRTQFYAELAERHECTKAEAKAFVEDFEAEVIAQVRKGEAVMLSGFVKFERKDRPSRMGRNPATGETIKIKAKRVVKVTPLKAFKDTVMAVKKKKS